MWEKAGGKTRFAEMKVKREESKSRAKVKREFATEAEAKRDKEKAVAARVCPGDTACHCCVETRLFIETELHRRLERVCLVMLPRVLTCAVAFVCSDEQAREVAVAAKEEAEALRQRVNKEEADEAVARANAVRATSAMAEYVQAGTMLLRRKLSSSVQIASLREGEVRRLRASFAETLVRIEQGVGRWNERWEGRYASERPPWEGRPEADRAGWSAEELVRQKSEAQVHLAELQPLPDVFGWLPLFVWIRLSNTEI